MMVHKKNFNFNNQNLQFFRISKVRTAELRHKLFLLLLVKNEMKHVFSRTWFSNNLLEN